MQDIKTILMVFQCRHPRLQTIRSPILPRTQLSRIDWVAYRLIQSSFRPQRTDGPFFNEAEGLSRIPPAEEAAMLSVDATLVCPIVLEALNTTSFRLVLSVD